MALPEYVNINGKLVRTSTLPPAIQKSVSNVTQGLTPSGQNPLTQAKNFTGKSKIAPSLVGILGSGSSSNISTKDPTRLKQLFDIMSSDQFTPRERIRAREILINSGIKHTQLHLGAGTPEVIAQLKNSANQQKFPEKKQAILQQIQELEKQGIALGNSSTRPELSKTTAERVFKIQQAYTQSKSKEVRDVLDSPEFKQIKESGGDIGGFGLSDLLNAKGVSAPRYETLILNELAQKDIQGDNVTLSNINNILNRSGFTNTVTFTDKGELAGLENNPLLDRTQSTINQIIGGAGALGDLGIPTSDLRFSDIPALQEQIDESEDSTGSGILDLLLSPIGLIVIGVIAVLLIFALKGK